MTDESFTVVCPSNEGQSALMGQVQHSLGERSAHLTFLLPGLPEPHPGLLALLDELAKHGGEMGATNLLAEVKDSDNTLEVLRRSGFSIYGWETIWKLPRKVEENQTNLHNWEPMTSVDEPAVRSLYQTLVPPLVQTAEPYSGPDIRRLIYRNNGEMIAYVESNSGPKGIYLKPIIHPAAEAPQALLQELVNIFLGLGKPVYLQMRSDQAWLTPFLEEICADTTVHFALMVRHLTIQQFSPALVQRRVLEHRQTETSATIVQKMAEPHK